MSVADVLSSSFVMQSSVIINFPTKFIFRFTTNCISYTLTPVYHANCCTFIVHEYVSLLVSSFIVLHPDAFCLGDFLYVFRWLINWRLYNHSTFMEFYSNWSLSITFIFFIRKNYMQCISKKSVPRACSS